MPHTALATLNFSNSNYRDSLAQEALKRAYENRRLADTRDHPCYGEPMKIRTVIAVVAILPTLFWIWLLWPFKVGVVEMMIIFSLSYGASWLMVLMVTWVIGTTVDLFRPPG